MSHKRPDLSLKNTTHGLSKVETKTYRSWKDMRARCYNSNNSEFHNYGARGVTICDRWSDFAKFFEDMGRRPDELTLDRIDVNGNYEPSNCRWADIETQANNKQNTRKVVIDGVERSLVQWCRLYGIKRQTAEYRFKKGLNPFSTEDYRV
jgi:hypothetical protein